MKKNLHKLLLTVTAIAAISSVNAAVWRVNNATGVSAHFAQLSTAVNHASVFAGDTIYVEGSTTNYNSVDLKKRLVIIGPGYFLKGTDGNDGLQQYPEVAFMNSFYMDSLGSGSVIMGMSGYFYLQAGTDDITLSRNNIDLYIYSGGVKASNIKINKNHIRFGSTIAFENLECINNIITGTCNLSSLNNSNILFRNNTLSTGSAATITNAYISNNIFLSGLNQVNCTIKYNIASGANTLPAGNNNQNGRAIGTVILNSGSSDGKFRLVAGSPAIAAGEPINGETPDCGAFGTADPYRLSGIPPVPTIYALTVPASVPSSATSMPVTISTRSNN